jgi:hypothetical protein
MSSMTGRGLHESCLESDMTDHDPDQPQDTPAQRETVAAIIARKVAGNPRFKLAPNTGRRFVIVGASQTRPRSKRSVDGGILRRGG